MPNLLGAKPRRGPEDRRHGGAQPLLPAHGDPPSAIRQLTRPAARMRGLLAPPTPGVPPHGRAVMAPRPTRPSPAARGSPAGPSRPARLAPAVVAASLSGAGRPF